MVCGAQLEKYIQQYALDRSNIFRSTSKTFFRQNNSASILAKRIWQILYNEKQALKKYKMKYSKCPSNY
jgi:hypothetical protein